MPFQESWHNKIKKMGPNILDMAPVLFHGYDIMTMGVDGPWWVSWASNPVSGGVTGRGGFDSHILPPFCIRAYSDMMPKILKARRIFSSYPMYTAISCGRR